MSSRVRGVAEAFGEHSLFDEGGDEALPSGSSLRWKGVFAIPPLNLDDRVRSEQPGLPILAGVAGGVADTSGPVHLVVIRLVRVAAHPELRADRAHQGRRGR